MMRRTSIGNEAFLLRLSWENADGAGFLGAWRSGRRLFLRHCGGGTAGGYCVVMLATAGRGEISGSAAVDEQTTVTVRGACPHDCPDTCAMLVSVRGGRAVEVRGDPEHP
ncbi:MAG: hypothetical protein ACLP8X_17390, partial [Streptosporangiaceae bacterium]